MEMASCGVRHVFATVDTMELNAKINIVMATAPGKTQPAYATRVTQVCSVKGIFVTIMACTVRAFRIKFSYGPATATMDIMAQIANTRLARVKGM